MLLSGRIIDNTYQVCEEIGAGGMGVVYLAYHLRLDKYVVMKKIKNPLADISLLRNEVDILKSLHHPCLPQVYDFISFEGDLYTIIDYIEGYDLQYYINNGIEITEGQLIKWLRQLCEVLKYLHSHRPCVLHADIKPANIIVQPDGDICLIDFGISLLGHTKIKGNSLRYSSPEQNYNVTCINEGYYESVLELDERTDIYSLGATFYQLVTLLEPTCLYALPSTLNNLWVPISEPFAKIIDKAVAYDREERFSNADAMLKAIDNMFKLSAKYKTYVLIQTLASVIACVMILVGAFLIVDSTNNQLKATFENDYNEYLYALDRKDMEQATVAAKKLLNSADYKDMMDTERTAEVYHGLGDCYYYSGDYQNAETCYAQAYTMAASYDRRDVLYRDYALAMIENGHISEANRILSELNFLYPDSASVYLITSQLKSRENEVAQAKSLIEQAITKAQDDNTRYTAYLLQGDLFVREKDYASAVTSYISARDVSENAVVLRKLGFAELNLAASRNDKGMYQRAINVYRTIYDSYSAEEEDVFNLAQCYLLSGEASGAQKCLSILTEYVQINPNSCKAYILMAVASDTVSDGKTAEYCRTAHNIYLQISEAEKNEIDSGSFNQIKILYRKYTKEVW